MLKSSRCTEMAIIWYGIGGEWSKKWKWRMVMFAEQEAIWLSSDIRQQFRGVCFQVWDRSLSPPSAKQNFGIIFLVKIRLLGYQPIDAPSYPSSANQNFWIFFVVNNSCFLIKMLFLGYHWISIISRSALDWHSLFITIPFLVNNGCLVALDKFERVDIIKNQEHFVT